jgi:cytoskeletal protein CcmA (bactofilin family)
VFEKIISKSPEDAPAPRPAPQAPAAASSSASKMGASTPSLASSAPTGGQRNILSNDVHIKGSVRFTNDLLVDGRIEGEISSDGALTVAENAHLKAEIKTKSVVIYGKVHGNIICTDRVEIKASAEMVGDVKSGTLSIEPGAIFVGKSEVGTPSAAPKKDSPSHQGNSRKQHGNNPSNKDVIRAS